MFHIVSYFGHDCSPRGEGQYELFLKDGTSRFATPEEILQAQKRMLQDQVYQIAAQKLNEQSSAYGDAEKATWGLLQLEAKTYKETSVVGKTLQEAVDNTLGIHTVDTLSNKLYLWKQYQDAVLQARAQHIKNILSTDNLDNYDATLGWPSL